MIISVTTPSRVLSFDVPSTMLVRALKQLIGAELDGLQASAQALFYQERQLLNTTTLQLNNIKANDLLVLKKTSSTGGPKLRDLPPGLYQIPAELIEHINATPSILNELLTANPTMAQAVLARNVSWFTQQMQQQNREAQQRRQAEQKRIAQLNSDPFNLEAQAAIEAKIKQQNIQQNMEQAMQLNPESFASVIMLYVPMEVNNIKMAAFIDSGAQMTCMSVSCAKRCNLWHLVDTRYQGTAVGVGTQKIVGRIHSVNIKFGKTEFKSSFSILEAQGMDFLFGLDQLRRHQACIDLRQQCLIIGDSKVPFLQEKDLPERVRNKRNLTDTKNSGGGGQSNNNNSNDANSNNTNNNNANKRSRTDPPTSSSSSSSSSTMSVPVPAPAPAPAPVPAPTPTGGNEAAIQTLVGLGFDRAGAAQALRQANGNVDVAAGLLFGGGF